MVSFALTTGAFGKDGNGEAVTGLTYDFSEITYSTSGAGSDSIGFDLDGWAGASIDFSGDFLFEVGLTGEVHVDLGHIDSTLEIGTDGFVVDGLLGEAAGLDTSGFTVDAYDVSPVGFDLAESYIELGFRAALEANVTASLSGYYDVGFEALGLEGEFSTQLFDNANIDIEFLQSLIPHTPFDIIGGLDGNIFKFELGDYVEVSVDIPEFEYEDPEYTPNDGGLDTINITGESSPFLSLEIGLASFILPPGIGPIGFDLGEDLLGEDLAEYFNIAVEGGLFDGKLVGTVSIGQDITIESEVGVDLVTSLGETLSGSLGDAFEFVTPEGEGEFTVNASYTLSQTVEAVTSLILNSQIDWRALFIQFEASVDVSVYSDTFEAAFALFEDTVDLGELLGLTYSFELFNDITTYLSEAGEETYTVAYENFVTAASGALLNLTTNQVRIVGGNIDNTINGNAHRNHLWARGGDDSIFGHDGDDRLVGGAGADDLNGGAGRDDASYQESLTAVTVNLLTMTASGGDAEGDTLISIEDLIGSAHNDTLLGDNQGNNLTGLSGDDRLIGYGGNDQFIGGVGADFIHGGSGVDTVRFRATSAGVTVDLAAGTGRNGEAEGDVYVSIENVVGTGNADTITGSAGKNTLSGGAGDDTINGGNGNDVIRGGSGADSLNGGDGIDTLDYSGSSVVVSVDMSNNNTIEGMLAGDTFTGFENLIGSDFGDILWGDNFENVIHGGEGVDSIYGGFGDDTINGGAEDDSLFGGEGADTFILNGLDTIVGGSSQSGGVNDVDVLVIDGTSGEYQIIDTGNAFDFLIVRLSDAAPVGEFNSIELVQFDNVNYASIFGFWGPLEV